MIYSNPRMDAAIENWPSGAKRVTAMFHIEQDPKRGERGTRITSGATKKLTYAKMARIVDGDDGRTYIAELSFYGHINIMQGNMKFRPGNQSSSAIPVIASVLELFAVEVTA